MPMNTHTIPVKDVDAIAALLSSIPFVRWDRYALDAQRLCVLYGWIERSQDSYKDFMVVSYDIGSHCWVYVTSSVAYDLEIECIHSKYHGVVGVEYNKCQRIEDLVSIPNMIILNGKKD